MSFRQYPIPAQKKRRKIDEEKVDSSVVANEAVKVAAVDEEGEESEDRKE